MTDSSSEDQAVQDLLRSLTPQPPSTIDAGRVQRGARRRRTRRSALSVGAAAVLVGGAITAVSLVGRETVDPTPAPAPSDVATTTPTDPPTTTAAPSGAGWQSAPAMPLSARWDAMTIWTGAEALVVGGTAQTFIGGPAPFPELADGAAFDPATSQWRRIADAPEPIGSRSYGPSIVVGDTVVVAQGNTLLAYDLTDDAWRTLPSPPAAVPQPTLAADPATDLLYVIDVYVGEGAGESVQVLALGDDTWSTLPDPGTPRLNGRSLAMTDAGLVLVGDDPGHSRAELWDGRRWTRFADSEVDGMLWHWTGSRLITTYRFSPQATRNGTVSGALDPTTGRWSALPQIPPLRNDLLSGGYPATDGPLVLQDGFLYDDSTGTTTPVGPPDPDLYDSAIVLGAGRVMTFGGYTVPPGQADQSRVSQVVPSAAVWVQALP